MLERLTDISPDDEPQPVVPKEKVPFLETRDPEGAWARYVVLGVLVGGGSLALAACNQLYVMTNALI